MPYIKVFQDWAMQGFYEGMREHGHNKKQAMRETIRRFKEYDEGKPLSIFIKG